MLLLALSVGRQQSVHRALRGASHCENELRKRLTEDMSADQLSVLRSVLATGSDYSSAYHMLTSAFSALVAALPPHGPLFFGAWVAAHNLTHILLHNAGIKQLTRDAEARELAYAKWLTDEEREAIVAYLKDTSRRDVYRDYNPVTSTILTGINGTILGSILGTM